MGNDMGKSKKEKAKNEKSATDTISPVPLDPGTSQKLKRKEYENKLSDLHIELVQLQEWVRHEKKKICVVFEGRDGAGKGGVIKALTERVSPRTFRVVALPAPTEREKSQMYVQRYLPHFPAATEVVIFDRSWYNRAGVERVMGFCTERELEVFFHNLPAVENAMVESGIILLKYWLEVSPEEQTRRLQARITDGRKLWKLSEMDLKSYARWDEYTRARATRCSRRRIHLGRLGASRDPTTKGGRGSISSPTCSTRFPMKDRHPPKSNCRSAKLAATSSPITHPNSSPKRSKRNE